MEFISLFDIIGPNMIGPSSSHTAGACSIAYLAQSLFKGNIRKVEFTLYGSFAKTYKGHGTDKALVGGILGYKPDDKNIRRAFEEAALRNIDISFFTNTIEKPSHPNTVDILIISDNDRHFFVKGESVGGGKVRITNIDGINVLFTGEYKTLIIKQHDTPGVLAKISAILSNHNVNIASVRLFREEKNKDAFSILENDDSVPSEAIEEIKKLKEVKEVILLSKE